MGDEVKVCSLVPIGRTYEPINEGDLDSDRPLTLTEDSAVKDKESKPLLREGDVVQEINGARPKKANFSYKEISEDILRDKQDESVVKMKMKRGGKLVEVNITKKALLSYLSNVEQKNHRILDCAVVGSQEKHQFLVFSHDSKGRDVVRPIVMNNGIWTNQPSRLATSAELKTYNELALKQWKPGPVAGTAIGGIAILGTGIALAGILNLDKLATTPGVSGKPFEDPIFRAATLGLPLWLSYSLILTVHAAGSQLVASQAIQHTNRDGKLAIGATYAALSAANLAIAASGHKTTAMTVFGVSTAVTSLEAFLSAAGVKQDIIDGVRTGIGGAAAVTGVVVYLTLAKEQKNPVQSCKPGANCDAAPKDPSLASGVTAVVLLSAGASMVVTGLSNIVLRKLSKEIPWVKLEGGAPASKGSASVNSVGPFAVPSGGGIVIGGTL